MSVTFPQGKLGPTGLSYLSFLPLSVLGVLIATVTLRVPPLSSRKGAHFLPGPTAFP